MSEPGPCTNGHDLEANFDQVCTIVGTYEVRPFHSKKGTLIAEWPVVVLEDGKAVLVESLWHPDRKPDAKAIASLQGRKVLATGLLQGEPPGSIQNLGLPCLSPVHSVRLVSP